MCLCKFPYYHLQSKVLTERIYFKIALALADWTLGKCQEYSKFSATDAWTEYKVVIDTLAAFKKNNPMSFHKAMHKLFVDASYVFRHSSLYMHC